MKMTGMEGKGDQTIVFKEDKILVTPLSPSQFGSMIYKVRVEHMHKNSELHLYKYVQIKFW
jgi:hypothetical protein